MYKCIIGYQINYGYFVDFIFFLSPLDTFWIQQIRFLVSFFLIKKKKKKFTLVSRKEKLTYLTNLKYNRKYATHKYKH